MQLARIRSNLDAEPLRATPFVHRNIFGGQGAPQLNRLGNMGLAILAKHGYHAVRTFRTFCYFPDGILESRFLILVL